MARYFHHNTDLAWSEAKDIGNFRLILGVISLLFIAAAVFISLTSLPEKEKKHLKNSALPPRYAKFLFEKKALPMLKAGVKETPKKKVEPKKKPKPKKKVEPKKKPKPKKKVEPKKKPKPKKKVEPKKKPKPKKKVEPKKKPKPKKTAAELKAESQKKAKEKVSKMGLAALGDLMALKRSPQRVEKHLISGQASTAPARIRRDILVAEEVNASTGIEDVQVVRVIEETQLAEHEIRKIKSSIQNDLDEEYALVGEGGRERGEKSIGRVFDQFKGKQLNPLYQRALRFNPDLKGKVVLKLTISPEGKVLHCDIISSDLNDQNLEKRLVSRVKRFEFGAQSVKETTVIYPIEFKPRE